MIANIHNGFILLSIIMIANFIPNMDENQTDERTEVLL